MRKVVESTFVTLDGVIENPQHWSPPYWDEEHTTYAVSLLRSADTLSGAELRSARPVDLSDPRRRPRPAIPKSR